MWVESRQQHLLLALLLQQARKPLFEDYLQTDTRPRTMPVFYARGAVVRTGCENSNGTGGRGAILHRSGAKQGSLGWEAGLAS